MGEILLELEPGGGKVPVKMIRTRSARRYILRLQPSGIVRVTVPWGGSKAFALDFVRKHAIWIRGQIENRNARAAEWLASDSLLFRGESHRIEVQEGANGARAIMGGEIVFIINGQSARSAMEQHLRRLAEGELPERTHEIARDLGLTFRRVTVRNQRSRWGSCSSRRVISLNWRLVQAPVFVRDYIIVHELMHLIEMNHSQQFWRLVEKAFPEWRRAEDWLKAHGGLLR